MFFFKYQFVFGRRVLFNVLLRRRVEMPSSAVPKTANEPDSLVKVLRVKNGRLNEPGIRDLLATEEIFSSEALSVADEAPPA